MYGNTHGLLGSGRTVKTALAAARGVFRIDSYGGDKNAPAPATPPDASVVIVQLLITTEKVIIASDFVFRPYVYTIS